MQRIQTNKLSDYFNRIKLLLNMIILYLNNNTPELDACIISDGIRTILLQEFKRNLIKRSLQGGTTKIYNGKQN